MPMPDDQAGMTAGPEAGWYQDPSGSPHLRWWDGSEWTSHVTTVPEYTAVTPAPQPGAAVVGTEGRGMWWWLRRHPGVSAASAGVFLMVIGLLLPVVGIAMVGFFLLAFGCIRFALGTGALGRLPKWARIIAGLVIVFIVSGAFSGGALGHVLAVIVLGFAAWCCLQAARSRIQSTARTWARIGAATFACLAVLVCGVAIFGGGSPSGSQPATQGKIVPHCYITVADTQGNILTISVIGESDCTNVNNWIAVNTTLRSIAIFTPNTGKGPGNAVCMGMLDGYPATVINPIDNPDNALCLTFGFSAMP